MKKRTFIVIILAVTVLSLAACSQGYENKFEWSVAFPSNSLSGGNYQYKDVVESGFVTATDTNSSYFSLDRNTASYSVMRRQIGEGLVIASNSVRLEEYVNYFSYNYLRPAEGEELALSGGVFDCPWNSQHKLLTVGIAAEEISLQNAVPNNLVFLIDTSGSMYGEDRLGLIQQSFTMLIDCLSDNDYVSIVTYAGDSRIALSGARGYEKVKIANVLQDLSAQGSTNGEGGIQKAYSIAEKYFLQGGNNRVILATDGDFNVGASSPAALKELISSYRNSGIYLSVLGVGMYNTNDTTMKTLAENGNGNYAYLDSVTEARKVLVSELNGTFNVVAKDAKIGVTFNSQLVNKYRLIGYETKTISQEEFDDEQKDSGEIGSGHTVTAVYEVELNEGTGEIATAEVRYKVPESNESKSVSKTFTTADITNQPAEDYIFIGCVVEFGLLLRNSEFKGSADFNNVIQRLSALSCVTGENCDPFKAEFLQIVQAAENIYKQ